MSIWRVKHLSQTKKYTVDVASSKDGNNGHWGEIGMKMNMSQTGNKSESLFLLFLFFLPVMGNWWKAMRSKNGEALQIRE